MSALVLLGPVALLLACGLLAFALRGSPRASVAVGAWGSCGAALAGLALTAALLHRGERPMLSLPWNPGTGASFSVGLDGLSGLFLLPLYALTAACAAYGAGYLRPARPADGPAGSQGRSWLAFSILAASMALVVLARNAVLFLVAWEAMSVSSWFLVVSDHGKESVRRAGVTYLVATQAGTAFLLALFLLLAPHGSAEAAGAAAGTPAGAALDFSRLGPSGAGAAGAAFILALVGFGTKAGVVPLHVWLPEAHPAAPSHVSALMSGVMIKTGVYGLVRVLTFLGSPRPWWGWTLAAVGAVSGVLGVLFAIAQHDIKRLLAYHSVENVGIIFLGLGLGVLGAGTGMPVLAALGFAGALLHVVNHALFKGLLFLGAGAAVRASATRELDRMGGLGRRMPLTSVAFLVGALAICGLPPFNGFVSEFLLYAGSLGAAARGPLPVAAAGAIAVAALALIGGLAAACFTKVFAAAFQGEPRTAAAADAREAPASMTVPVLALAVACAAVGLAGSLVVRAVAPLACLLAGQPPGAAQLLGPSAGAMGKVLVAAAVLAGVGALLAGLRALLLRRRTVTRGPTWDCGYSAPTPRMQYTSSSFAQPLLAIFRGLVPVQKRHDPPQGLFPVESSLSTEAPDPFARGAWEPLFRGLGWLAGRLRLLQRGRLQLYVLYIAAALAALLVWKLV